MRYLFAFITGLMLPFACVASPAGVVAAYECFHVDTAVSGFKCDFLPEGEATVTFMEDINKWPDKKRGRALYEFNKIGVRFIELGMERFEVRYAYGPNKDKIKNICRPSKDRVNFKCMGCEIQSDGSCVTSFVDEAK